MAVDIASQSYRANVTTFVDLCPMWEHVLNADCAMFAFWQRQKDMLSYACSPLQSRCDGVVLSLETRPFCLSS